MKKFLTTLAVLTAFATPAFAQSFDPDTGTGNVLSFVPHADCSPRPQNCSAAERATLFRHGSGTRLGFQFGKSSKYGRWQPRLQRNAP